MILINKFVYYEISQWKVLSQGFPFFFNYVDRGHRGHRGHTDIHFKAILNCKSLYL